MAEVRISVDDSDARLALTSKTHAVSSVSLAQFLRSQAVPWFQDRADARFATEGDDAVGNWLPLKHPTQAIRRAAGYGATGPINVRTGQLEDFVTGSSGDVRSTANTASLKWPDETPQGELGRKIRTAQRGRKGANTLARPVIGMNQIDAAYLTNSLMGWIADSGTHGLEIS